MSKKVIIITDDFPPKSGGGAAIVASIHAETLKNRGYEIVVLTTVQDRSLVGEFLENGIRIKRLYSKYSPRFRAFLSLYNPFVIADVDKFLKKEKADIVHFHNIHYHLSYHSIFLAKKYSKAVFVTIHDSMPFHYSKLFPKYPFEISKRNYKISSFRQFIDFRMRFNPFRKIIIRKYLKIPHKIFAVSFALKEALMENNINNVEVIHNGIDVKKWISDFDSVERFKSENNLIMKKIILFCGRLSRAKGGELIVKCIPEILKVVPNAILLIVGDIDKEAQNMLDQARKINIDSKLVFTGKLSGKDIINAYGACDMLVSPSLCFDWFPTVNLEAMIMKKPVITTCFGGASEAVIDKISGYVINPYQRQQLVDSIINILDNKDIAENFGKNGYEKVLKYFNVDRYVDLMIFWYKTYNK